jgi:hypothetical protein
MVTHNRITKTEKKALKEKQSQEQQYVDFTHLPYWLASFHMPVPSTPVYSRQPGCQVTSWPWWWRWESVSETVVELMWCGCQPEKNSLQVCTQLFSNVMKHDQLFYILSFPCFYGNRSQADRINKNDERQRIRSLLDRLIGARVRFYSPSEYELWTALLCSSEWLDFSRSRFLRYVKIWNVYKNTGCTYNVTVYIYMDKQNLTQM